MKIRKLLNLTLIGLVSSFSGFSQLVGDQIFLQGRYLEVGVAPNASWGNTMPIPAGYHVHSAGDVFLSYPDPITGTAPLPSDRGIDFSYDVGHDGWTVGSPASTNCCHYGPYFLPGTPFDGWAIQMNGIRSDAYFTSSGFALGAGATAFSGTNVAYRYWPGSSAGPFLESSSAGYWAGTYSAGGGTVSIRSMNRVDTNASWDLVTVTIKNTGATPVTDFYYLVTGDPDNDVMTPPGSYPTDNHIAFQGDALNRVGVYGTPPAGTPHPDAVSGIVTKDCRARAFLYSSWPSAITASLAGMWDGTTTAIGTYTQSVDSSTLNQDWAYGLVFKIGTLAPGDSSRISFAWIFSDSTAVDSAFVDPVMLVNGNVMNPVDTFDPCGLPDSVGFNIAHGEWGLTEWTWAPATGLATTRGFENKFAPSAIRTGITYTITATDLASCNPARQWVIRMKPCHSAGSNSPGTGVGPGDGIGIPDLTPANSICEGDTLHLYDRGDSTGATYVWYGPSPTIAGAPFAAVQNTFRYPTTMADTGWYHVIKTVAGVNDTARAHVLIRKRPNVTATYSAPLCSGSNLNLFSNPDYATETWSWTGPNGFASVASDPTRLSVRMPDSGDYKVITELNGCFDSATIHVHIDTTPVVPVITSNHALPCEDSALKLFSSTETALPGITYAWTGPSGFTSTLQNPVIDSASSSTAGIYTVVVTLGMCSSRETITIGTRVRPRPILGSNSPVCSGQALNLTTTAPPGSTFWWTGPLSYTSTLQYPSINPAITANSGVYSVVVTLAGCVSDTMGIAVVVDSTPEVPILTTNSPGPPGATICQEDTLTFTANSPTGAGVTYQWTGPASFTSTQQNPFILPSTPVNSGIYTVVASLGACTSTATIAATVTPTPPISISSNSPICSGDKDTVKLFATGNPGSTFTWDGPYTFFSAAANPVRTPAVTEYSGVYHATVLLDGCTNTVGLNYIVKPTPTPPWTKWLTFCQYYDAPYLQAFGTNVLWYPSSDPTATGTSTAPKPPTDVVGVKFYFVTQTINGCISAIDSFRVRIDPTPTVSVSEDQVICPRDSVKLVAVNPDAIAYYHWSPSLYLNDTASAIVTSHPETDVDYRVISSNVYGCSDTATVSIRVKDNAVIHLPDSALIYPGESFHIQPMTNCSRFTWTPSGGLNGKYISNPVASPEVSTKYVVVGVTEDGCVARDSIMIRINDESVFSVPNAFAPGRGTNDVFRLIRRGNATLRHFRIYDRWGVMVFETTNVEEGWDGTFKGVPQPIGVYVYEVSAVSGTGKEFKKAGNVTLLR